MEEALNKQESDNSGRYMPATHQRQVPMTATYTAVHSHWPLISHDIPHGLQLDQEEAPPFRDELELFSLNPEEFRPEELY